MTCELFTEPPATEFSSNLNAAKRSTVVKEGSVLLFGRTQLLLYEACRRVTMPQKRTRRPSEPRLGGGPSCSNQSDDRCLPTSPLISSIVTSSLPMIARSGPSHRMLRLLAGFCSLCALM